MFVRCFTAIRACLPIRRTMRLGWRVVKVFGHLCCQGFRPWRLFADLGLDPGRNGCQNERPNFSSSRRRQFGPHSALILWQIAMGGNLGFYQERGIGGVLGSWAMF